MTMNDGLPPTYNCASGTTSQPAQNRFTDSNEEAKPPFKLNPKAPPFIPRASGVDRLSNTPTTINRRQTTACLTLSSQTLHPSVKRTSPEAASEKINSAFDLLMNQNFIDAENTFRAILQEYADLLRTSDYQRSIIGLARSLREQTCEKQKEACFHLEKLRLTGELNEFGASTIRNLDLTLSLCEQTLGKNPDAEARLLKLRDKKPGADEETLCQHSNYFDADMANARLWQFMRKYQLTEKLLHSMKYGLIVRLQWNLHAALAEKLQDFLHKVNIALARCWQETGQYEWAEDLLLNMSGKYPGNSIELLCKPSRHNDVNLALVRLWEVKGKHELAERLMLAMSGKCLDDNEETLCTPFGKHEIDLTLAQFWQVTGKHQLSEKLLLNLIDKHPDDAEEILFTPSGKHDIDLALARLWEVTGQYQRSEKLLLSMSVRHPDVNEETLCQPCGHNDIDLTLVRLWQKLNKHKQAEILLLNMSNKRPDAAIEELCRPCGNHDIDLALALHWEIENKHHLSEGLLLNMSNKHLFDSEDSLCMPCGNHDIDLALVRLWQMIDKDKQAEKLIERCCDLYHSDECELSHLSLSVGKASFMEVINRYPESANQLLVISIHYFALACKEISEAGPKSGEENLIKALEHVELTLERYPPTAGAYSQKAHCLRMMGKNEQEWGEYFQKANALDSARKYKGKTDAWRSNEYAALQKVFAQT
ncbi:hypothetical protein [Endozoicomonas sp. ALC020]|uniref:hypothetical protein n=1 Tax=Endozoicomonas sp. ALC020 TaxID=3403077 RepID=UPI003BB15A28